MSCPAAFALGPAALCEGALPPCRPAPSPSRTSTPGLSHRQWLIHPPAPLSHDVSGDASPVGVWRGGPILAATTVGDQPLGTSHSPLLSCHAEISAQPRLGGTGGAVRVESGVESGGTGSPFSARGGACGRDTPPLSFPLNLLLSHSSALPATPLVPDVLLPRFSALSCCCGCLAGLGCPGRVVRRVRPGGPPVVLQGRGAVVGRQVHGTEAATQASRVRGGRRAVRASTHQCRAGPPPPSCAAPAGRQAAGGAVRGRALRAAGPRGE
jgi:hypothetical protein